MADLLAANRPSEITPVSNHNQSRPLTSVVVPAYGSPESLTELFERISAAFHKLDKEFELVLVNDGCPRNSWATIQTLAARDPRVIGINLSRNFTQQRAILAGLDHARGDTIIVMDCDLQDPPEAIGELFACHAKGHDTVIALRQNRKESFFKKLGSRLFTRVFNYMTDSDLGEHEINFSLFTRRVLECICRVRDQNVFYLLTLHWVGFDIGYVEIEHAARKHGKSSYTLKSLLKLAFSSILAHSNKPLKLMITFGFGLAFLAMLYTVWLFAGYFLFDIPVAGWTSIMVSLFFLFGALFTNMGIVGLYIGRCFDETKNRPLYLVKETLNYSRKEPST